MSTNGPRPARSRVVVVGGTSGIGLATAKLAMVRGHDVAVGSSSSSNVAKAAADLGNDAVCRPVDIRDASSVGEFFEHIGPFDHLVCTAGTPIDGVPFEQADQGAAEETFEIGLFAAIRLVRSALPTLAGTGSITLTSGTLGVRPSPGYALSSSLCGAIEGLVRGLAVDLAPRRVNAVSPGVVDSPLWRTMRDSERAAFLRDEAARLPLGRTGDVDDAAEGILHLVSQTYTTGAVLGVDGGALLV